MFERIMLAQGIPEERWSFMIALQLTWKAQQAYTTMKATEAAEYWVMKDAILLRYDINCAVYWQRFQQVKQQQRETPQELVTQLRDLEGSG